MQQSEGRNSGTLRVATYNIWARHGAWAERRPLIASALQELQPDIIAFQEAVVLDGYDQVVDLLGPGYHIVHQPGRTDDGVGASIASRWPFVQVGTADLKVTPRVDAAVGWIGSLAAVELQVPGPIGALLFAQHKPSWQWGYERERELQAVAAARFIEALVQQRSLHVVLAGDFDAPPEAASMRFWRGLQSLGGLSVCYADAWERTHPRAAGHTFSPRNPLVRGGEMPLERGRRIDYILLRCGVYGPSLNVVACKRILDRPVSGSWASDHFGVVADLALPATRQRGA